MIMESSAEPVMPGDIVYISQTAPGCTRGQRAETQRILGWDTPAAARRAVEELLGSPGGYEWKLQSPGDLLEPSPGGQLVIWEYVHPEGHVPAGSVGYQVRWGRNQAARG